MGVKPASGDGAVTTMRGSGVCGGASCVGAGALATGVVDAVGASEEGVWTAIGVVVASTAIAGVVVARTSGEVVLAGGGTTGAVPTLGTTAR